MKIRPFHSKHTARGSLFGAFIYPFPGLSIVVLFIYRYSGAHKRGELGKDPFHKVNYQPATLIDDRFVWGRLHVSFCRVFPEANRVPRSPYNGLEAAKVKVKDLKPGMILENQSRFTGFAAYPNKDAKILENILAVLTDWGEGTQGFCSPMNKDEDIVILAKPGINADVSEHAHHR